MIGAHRTTSEWLESTFANVPRETWHRIEAFEALLRGESQRQNLISRATFDHFQARHIVDSAQLLEFAPASPSQWLDLGSGAGFPGLIIAALSSHEVTLVESRRLRVEFLRRAAEVLNVADRTTIIGRPVERIEPQPFEVVSARAFAPLPRLLELAHPFSTEKTRWILPKGRSAQSELEHVRSSWQGDFRLAPSLTDPDARIIIAEGIRPRRRREPR